MGLEVTFLTTYTPEPQTLMPMQCRIVRCSWIINFHFHLFFKIPTLAHQGSLNIELLTFLNLATACCQWKHNTLDVLQTSSYRGLATYRLPWWCTVRHRCDLMLAVLHQNVEDARSQQYTTINDLQAPNITKWICARQTVWKSCTVFINVVWTVSTIP